MTEIKEIEGQKYIKVNDKWVPLFETIEEMKEYKKDVH